jgi:hypothetical protein
MDVVTVAVAGGYRARPESLTVITRRATSAKRLTSRTPARLYGYETLLQRLAQNLQHMAAALGQFILEEQAVVGQRHFARHRDVAAANQSRLREGLVGHGQVVTNAVRSSVRPATRGRRVVSRALARVMAGRMVTSRRASIDVPAPGGPRRKTLWSERLHHVQVRLLPPKGR